MPGKKMTKPKKTEAVVEKTEVTKAPPEEVEVLKAVKKRGSPKGVRRGPHPVQKIFVDTTYQGVDTQASVYQASLNGKSKLFPCNKEGLTAARFWIKMQRGPKAVPTYVKGAKRYYNQLQKLELADIPSEKHEYLNVLCQALELLVKPYFDLKVMHTTAPVPVEDTAAELLRGLGSE